MSQKINVDIITEYKGRQNLKSAEKDMNVLGDAAKKLGSIFLATFSAEKIISFGKASVAAFAADQKSAAILANTLSNLGQTMSDVPVENFITKLSDLNGIAKTDLRSSFDTLVRSTGDAKKAQDLLNLTLDISAGTTKDVALVSTALAKAYGGNYAAISKLGAGVSKTLLATKDFTKIQGFLTATFKGNASTAAESYQGKIDRLKTSYEEFKITIGKGLVDAFANLSSKGKLSDFQDSMANTATNIANMVTGLGLVLGYVDKIGSATIKKDSFFDKLFNAGKILAIGGIFGLANATLGEKQAKDKAAADKAALEAQNLYGAKAKYFAAIAAKAAAKAIADAKALTQAQKDKLALERASLSLKLAGQTTDMQNIEIQAALQRGQNAEVTNVLLLQRAILSGNADQANVLAQQVLKANGLVMDVNGNISSLAGAKNPFKDWPPATSAALAQVKAIQDSIASIQDKKVTITVTTVTVPGGGGGSTANGVAGTTKLASGAIAGLVDDQGFTYMQPAAGAPQIDPSKFGSGIMTYDQANFSKGASAYYDNLAGVNSATTGTQPIAVTVNLNGQTVGNAITNAQVDSSASGIPSSFQRSGFGSAALAW